MATVPILLSPENKQKCRTAVRLLKRENVIALSTVSDGPGPLSLIQVCTLKGTVYLFDVLKNGKVQDEDFLRDTGLEAVLTSTEIVKVVSSFAKKSAALFYQFGIRLNHVFDTELEWNKKNSNFSWTNRPLTQDMIQFACGKVTVLIPDTYEDLKRYLEENRLVYIFTERVQEEMESDINPDIKERRKKRVIQLKYEVLASMAVKYEGTKTPVHITDEDEKCALDNATLKEISLGNYPEVIRELKMESLAGFLKYLKADTKTPDTFYPTAGMLFKLNEITELGAPALKEEGIRIKELVLKIFADDLEKKYDVNTPLTDLSQHDIKVVEALRPFNDNTTYPKTVLDMYWKMTEEELNKELEKLATDVWYEAHNVHQLKRLDKDSRVPENLRIKAREVSKKNEDGVIERLPRKYSYETSVDQLDDVEKHALAKLDVIRNNYDTIVVFLHWEVTYVILCKEFKDFQSGILQDKPWLTKKLAFLTANDQVTEKVKRKAEEFQRVVSRN